MPSQQLLCPTSEALREKAGLSLGGSSSDDWGHLNIMKALVTINPDASAKFKTLYRDEQT